MQPRHTLCVFARVMLSGGSSSSSPPFGNAATPAASGAAVGAAASAVLAPFGPLSAVGAAIAGVAGAVAASETEPDLEVVKEKVERDPTLWRRDGESFQEWVKRLGIFSLVDDVHEQRRFQLRAVYTDKLQALSERFTEKPSKRSEVMLGQPIKI